MDSAHESLVGLQKEHGHIRDKSSPDVVAEVIEIWSDASPQFGHQQQQIDHEVESEARLNGFSVSSTGPTGGGELFTPIHGLPNDVLISVFEEALRDYIDNNNTKPSPQYLLPIQPFILASVCHYWRDVMLVSPTLWTILIVNLDLPTWPNDPAIPLTVFLERSGSLPLHLSIIQSLPTSRTLQPQAMSLIMTLLGSSDRVKTLALQVHEDPFICIEGSVSFPNLTHLHYYHAGGAFQQDLSNFSWISSLPRLHDIHLRDAHFSLGFSNALKDSKNAATIYGIHVYFTDNALEFLTPVASHVEVVILDLNDPGELGQSGLASPLRMERVQELYFDCSYDHPNPALARADPFPGLLNSITTPSAHIIRLSDTDKYSDPPRAWDRAAFENYVRRSQISTCLTVVIISSTFFSDDDAIHLVNLLPNLRFFSLSSFDESLRKISSCSAAFMHHITPLPEGNQPILPKLEALRLSIRGKEDIPQRLRAAAELAEIRSQAVGYQRLRSLDIWVDDELEDTSASSLHLRESIARLSHCKIHGVRVNLRPMPGNGEGYGDTFVDSVKISRTRRLVNMEEFPF